MEEAAEAQSRVCDIHYKQMDKSDRDWSQTVRAEDECKQLLIQFPNSKFAPQAAQRVRDIQESLAAHEFVVGNFYWKRDMNPAAANRLNALVDQYPLYSNAGEALYEAGDAYSKMGPRFRRQAGEMFARILREYPLSSRADDAKHRLEDLEMPIPQADPAALARAKFEQANYHKQGLMADLTGWIRGTPDVSHAAKSGQPTMTDPKRTIPASVPVVNTEAASNTGTGLGTTDVSATTTGSNSLLDKSPDARKSNATQQTASDQNAQPLPTNRDKELKKYREQQAKKQAALEKKKKKANKDQQGATQAQQGQPAAQQNQSSTTQGAQSPVATPNAASTPNATGAQAPNQNPPSHP
jgi:outer membrane protein assembly factor BamD